MSQFFPYDLNNNNYDFAKCYNEYDNVEGISSSKHIPWKSSTFDNTLASSTADIACSNSMLKCRNGNLIENNPYGILTTTTKVCNAPPNYSYYNKEPLENTVSFDKVKSKYKRPVNQQIIQEQEQRQVQFESQKQSSQSQYNRRQQVKSLSNQRKKPVEEPQSFFTSLFGNSNQASELEDESEPDSDVEAETEPETEAESEAEAETEAESEAESEAETEQETEAEDDQETEAESEQDAEEDQEAESEQESEDEESEPTIEEEIMEQFKQFFRNPYRRNSVPKQLKKSKK